MPSNLNQMLLIVMEKPAAFYPKITDEGWCVAWGGMLMQELRYCNCSDVDCLAEEYIHVELYA